MRQMVLALALLGAASGCDSETGTEPPEMQVTSSAYQEGGNIPSKYECKDGLSIPVSWSAGAAGTKSFVLVLDDLSNGAIHWIVSDLPPDTRELKENAADTGLPPGAQSKREYFGPCPLEGGQPHDYRVRVYARPAATTTLGEDPKNPELEAQLTKDSLVFGELNAKYAR
jgi:phosphatidylethanolamine-binding protein (PEBP) family uncharacterized protein